MAIKYDKVEPGMLLHDWGQDGTILHRPCSWSVHIIEKHETHCIVSWNGNKPRRMERREVETLRRESFYDHRDRKAREAKQKG